MKRRRYFHMPLSNLRIPTTRMTRQIHIKLDNKQWGKATADHRGSKEEIEPPSMGKKKNKQILMMKRGRPIADLSKSEHE